MGNRIRKLTHNEFIAAIVGTSNNGRFNRIDKFDYEDETNFARHTGMFILVKTVQGLGFSETPFAYRPKAYTPTGEFLGKAPKRLLNALDGEINEFLYKKFL